MRTTNLSIYFIHLFLFIYEKTYKKYVSKKQQRATKRPQSDIQYGSAAVV